MFDRHLYNMLTTQVWSHMGDCDQVRFAALVAKYRVRLFTH
jgi:hypothetical protein